MHLRVINPTITSEWDEDTRRTYEAVAPEGVHVTVAHLPHGTASIEHRRDIALVAPWVVEAAVQAEREGCDGVIVDCMIDPGVAEAREAVSIPVLGPAEASIRFAAQLGHTFSILTVAQHLRAMMRAKVRETGVLDRLASVRSLDIPVLELDTDPAHTSRTTVELARRAVTEDAAEVIIPGCTGLAGEAAHIDTELRAQHLGVTVIDPPAAALTLLLDIIEQGLSHSNITYSPRTPTTQGYTGLSFTTEVSIKGAL